MAKTEERNINLGQGTGRRKTAVARVYLREGNGKITVNKTNGKITVKKGLKKGSHKVQVKIKAAGNSNYKASAVKTVTVTIIVK